MVNFDKDDRIITLIGDIDQAAAMDVCHYIGTINISDKSIKRKHRSPIIFNLDSYGGEIYPMWSIISKIEESKTPVHIYCGGYVMSAAFIIFLSGHKRFASKHATFMYHELSSWSVGYLKDIKEDVAQMEILQAQIDQFVKSKCYLSKKEIEKTKDSKSCLYMTAKEAKKMGVFDKYF